MKYLFGFTGAHRTGKTTLCKELSGMYTNLTFVRTTASVVFKRLKLDPAVSLEPLKRLYVQRHILDELERQWSSFDGLYAVTDRCPSCLVAYTVSDFKAHIDSNNLQPGSRELGELPRYIKDCMEVQRELFCRTIFVRPGIPIVYEEGKAECSEDKINEIDRYIEATLEAFSGRVKYSRMPKEIVDLGARKSISAAVITAAIQGPCVCK